MPESCPKIILFDIDGTLLTCRGAGQKAMEIALNQTFGVQPPFSPIPCAGRTDRAICTSIFQTFEVSDTEPLRKQFRDSYLQHLPDCLRKQNAKLLPGVIPLLNELQSHPEFTVSVLTGNYHEAANIKLDHFAIRDRFQAGIYGDQHGERDRLAEEAVLLFSQNSQMPVPGDSFLIVGDTPADIRCARSIGAKVIAVATGIHRKDTLASAAPDVLLDDLNDIKQVTNSIARLFNN